MENLQVTSKSLGDFVSKADHKAEEIIFEELIEARPHYGWLAEESSPIMGKDPTRRWIVDPLDGTANYNRNIPICCVSIGLVKNMKPLIGVIFDFNNEDVFSKIILSIVFILLDLAISLTIVSVSDVV